MAKDDPMAKARKAQKQKDKKRNKVHLSLHGAVVCAPRRQTDLGEQDARDKARDAKAVKQDSRGLESTVRRLEEARWVYFFVTLAATSG